MLWSHAPAKACAPWSVRRCRIGFARGPVALKRSLRREGLRDREGDAGRVELRGALVYPDRRLKPAARDTTEPDELCAPPGRGRGRARCSHPGYAVYEDGPKIT